MAEPTSTLASLRPVIGRRLGMPFFKLFTTTSILTGTPTAEILYDSALTQPDHYWEGSYVYLVSGTYKSSVREVISFQAKTDAMILDRVHGGAPAPADTYELHTGWTGFELNDAINAAIDSSFPAFFDVTSDETTCACEDTLEYSLAGLAITPWKMLTIWVEQPTNAVTGLVATADATHVTLASTDTCADMETFPTNYTVNIYDGKGKGQVRTPSAYNNTTKQVTVAAWTTTPDTTSKYKYYDKTAQLQDWQRLFPVRFDQKDWPSKMYFTSRYSDLWGNRFRLQYLNKPLALALEDSTTVVPSEYIILKALSLLYANRSNVNRFDRSRFGQMAQQFAQEAEKYKREHMWSPPPASFWADHEAGGRYPPTDGDPMGWF